MRDVATQTQQACTPFAEMSCGHLFHKSCIEKSLIYRSLSCPLCRHSYVATERYKEIQQRGQLLCQKTCSLESPLFSNEDKRNYLRQIRSKDILSGVNYSTLMNMTELFLELNEDA